MISGVARLAWGISGLALIVHVERAADSYAAAGLAVGALGLTSAVLAPLRGAIVDRRGRAALLVMTLAETAAVLAIALTPAAGPQALSYIMLAGAAGLVAPPFTAWTRAGLARRLHGAELQRAYTVDNVFEESAFVFGPLVAGLVIVVASAGVALIVASALTVAGGLVLTLNPRALEWAPPRRAARRGPRAPLNRPLLLTIVSLGGLGAGVGFVEVAVIAFAESEGSQATAGIVFSALSAGGIAGALVYGSRPWPLETSRQYALLLGAAAVGLGALSLAESVPAMTVLIAIAGLVFTPIFITNSLLIEQLSPAGPTAMAFAGVTTAMNGGVALGAAVGGGVIDAGDTGLAFLLAGAAVAAGALLAAGLRVPGSPTVHGPEMDRG